MRISDWSSDVCSSDLCQDNEISWLDWTPTPEREALTAFVQRMMALRSAHPTFRRRDFFAGRPLYGGEPKDVLWLKPDGQEMSSEEWEHERSEERRVGTEGGRTCRPWR